MLRLLDNITTEHLSRQKTYLLWALAEQCGLRAYALSTVGRMGDCPTGFGLGLTNQRKNPSRVGALFVVAVFINGDRRQGGGDAGYYYVFYHFVLRVKSEGGGGLRLAPRG